MARIPTYQKDLVISDLDRLIGTDGDTNELTTKNFYLSDIAEYVIDKFIDPDAVSFTIPVFRDGTDTLGENATRITGSIISQDTNPDGTLISIAGKLQVDKEAKIKGKLTEGVAESGSLVINSSLNATGITIKAPVHADLTSSYTMELPNDIGTPGAQLTTDGISKVYWADAEDDNLNFAGDLGSGTVDLDTQTLTIAGGLNVETSVLDQTLTIDVTGFVEGQGTAYKMPLWTEEKVLANSLVEQAENTTNSRLTISSPQTVIGQGHTPSYNQHLIGAGINASSNTIVDANTTVALGNGSVLANRYRNVAIADRQLRIGKNDDIGATSANTTGFINFNDSAQANSAYVNVGGFVGYFPPPTATNNYYFLSAFSENVQDSVFQTGASPTASRVNFSTDPGLSCIMQKFDANTTNGAAMYVVPSNNSPTASSRGIVTFDVRHQNQSANVPNGHKLFEITAGYGNTKFVLKQVDGETNIGIGSPDPQEKLDVDGNIKLDETAATIDTDKFVVLDSGVLKYRTGAEVLSDIGAGTSNFSGDYNDLTNKPALATVATTGAYSDLSGTPSLATVATTGSYADLSGTPSLAAVATSGSYTDLSDTPTIPTNNNELINGAGYTTNTGTVDGTGTANTLAMWSDADTLTDSSITESVSGVMISDDTKIMGHLTVGEVGTPGDLKLPTSGSNIDVGTNTTTGSDNSIALGSGNTVNAAYAIATGQSNNVTGNESIAAGFGNDATNIQSQAFGFGNTASAEQSAAFGNTTTASGARAFSTGFETTASGLNATVHGTNNTASGTNSFVSGANSTASAFNSTALGNNLNVTSGGGAAAGVWNLDAGNYRFQVGVGTNDANRINAFSVNNNGIILAHVLKNSASYGNDSQAAAGGVPIGGLYRHGSIVQIRID